MSTGWENHEPAPMEFFHGILLTYFHEFRLSKTKDINITMDGSDFSRIIVKAKQETYAKYPKQKLKENILKTEM